MKWWMKPVMCVLSVFALWMLLFWSLDPGVIGSGVFFALIVGALLVVVGALIIGGPAWKWAAGGFGALEPAVSMRPMCVRC